MATIIEHGRDPSTIASPTGAIDAGPGPAAGGKRGFGRQPKAVWAVGFAAVVSFMGIGLVDPILPVIAEDLHATAGQVSLLFTSYMLITGIAMLGTGWISSRIGAKKTLLAGLTLVVVFAALAATSGSVNEVVTMRGGWGLGNALFIATALATIVGAASGGAGQAVIIYEAAMGVGMAMGPLVGGALGSVSWRAPFFGTAALMAISFIVIVTLLPKTPKPSARVSIRQTLGALSHGGLASLAIVAFLYNMGFFVLLSQSPFKLEDLGAMGIGLVFFGWGLALAISSVLIAPRIHHRFGRIRPLYIAMATLALCLVGEALAATTLEIVVAIVVGGACLGLCNTLLTEAAMEVSHHPRSVASAAYSAVRFTGGAIATFIAGQITVSRGVNDSFYYGAIALLAAIAVLAICWKHLRHIDRAMVESGDVDMAAEAEILSAADA